IVHCPAEEAPSVRSAITAASLHASETAFGPTPVRIPFTVASVECYADAKAAAEPAGDVA
ncbi:MAG: hypothetical protein LBV78_03945, partial [Kitasatospora sp.]|nr:hypothetical protein [Kitasatospora sp.]